MATSDWKSSYPALWVTPTRGFLLLLNACCPVIFLLETVFLGSHLCVVMTTASSSTAEQEVDKVPRFNKQFSDPCYPCNCPNSQPNCKVGVSMQKDGCGCCFICTRQQGDLCDARNICDDDRGLYCDFDVTDNPNQGICRAKLPKPCDVDGRIFKDGQQFKPNCTQLCTCQDGKHSCTSQCPWEERPPSTIHCRRPQLVRIEGRCCKEWVCPPSHLEPTAPHKGQCKFETTEWSSCTQTCGMGMSIRLTNENEQCQSVQERRLCFVRPCDQQDNHLRDGKCKSTWKLEKPIRILYDRCESTELYKPKYCSTCKKGKCCGPGRTKTRQIQFRCVDGKVFTEPFMWIKNCECFKSRRCPFI